MAQSERGPCRRGFRPRLQSALLELGCGLGTEATQLQAEGFRAVGADRSEAVILRAAGLRSGIKEMLIPRTCATWKIALIEGRSVPSDTWDLETPLVRLVRSAGS